MNQTTEKKSLREDQIQDLACIIRDKKFGLFSDPGTGKTPPANVFMYWLWKTKQQKTVFVMPLSIPKQNKRSFFKFTHFKEDEIVLVRGTLAQRQKLMANPNAKVFIVGFDFFKPLESKRFQRESDWDFLCRHHPDINACVVDELHMGFGSITSKRTQWWINAMKKMEYFVPMTGTATDGKLSTVYPMIHVIEPRYYFNYQAFLNEHAILDYWGSVIGWRNTDKVRKILEKHGVRRSFESVHGKDNILLETEYVEMDKQHRKMYDDFESTNMLELEKEFLEASGGGVAVLRLRQIMQCPSALDPQWEKHVTAKEEALERHILAAWQANKRILVFGSFHEEQKRILKIFEKHKIPAGLINGNVSASQRDKIDEQFKAGTLFGVVASPGTVAVGYDWDHVDYMVFHSLDYKDSNFSQGYRRAIRGAREHPLLCYILEFEDTRDQTISGIVETKMKLAAEVQPDKTVFNLTRKEEPKLSNRTSNKKLTMKTMT
jgi:ERCC4-related helicase